MNDERAEYFQHNIVEACDTVIGSLKESPEPSDGRDTRFTESPRERQQDIRPETFTLPIKPSPERINRYPQFNQQFSRETPKQSGHEQKFIFSQPVQSWPVSARENPPSHNQDDPRKFLLDQNIYYCWRCNTYHPGIPTHPILVCSCYYCHKIRRSYQPQPNILHRIFGRFNI